MIEVDRELFQLCRQVARLLNRRSTTPRGEALGLAFQAIKGYADRHGLDEEFCDRVLLEFLSSRHDILVAAA